MVVMKRICFIGLSLLLTLGISAQPGKDASASGEKNEVSSRFTDRKEKGFYSIMQASFMLGAGQIVSRPVYYPVYQPFSSDYIAPAGYYPDVRPVLTVSPSFTLSGGYMFNEHWSAGAGAGFEISSYNLFPLFAEMRYTLWDQKISPFFVLKSGFSFAGFKARHYDELYLDWAPYYASDASLRHYGGFMFNPEAGVKVPLNENSDLLITAAYRFQKTKSVARKEYEQEQFDEWEHKEQSSRLSFGVAIMFR